MREALMFNNGIKATHVAVIQANRRTQATVSKIDRLAELNVFEYVSDGQILCHRRVKLVK